MATETNKDCKTVWDECLKIIKDNVGEEKFNVWFAPLVPLRLENGIITIQVPSPYFYEWLETNYLSLLRRVIKNQLGPTGKLQYSVVMDHSVANDPITTTYPSTAKQAVQNPATDFPKNLNDEGKHNLPNPFVIPGLKKIKVNSQLKDDYTLGNFVEGDCNRLARTAGIQVAHNPGITAFNPLFIYGGVGLGKTHLSNAIGIQTKLEHPEKQVLYVTSEQFMHQFGEAARNKNTNDFLHFYEVMDMLIIDDIQFWANKAEKTQEMFFHIFNYLHQRNKQIIITSDRAPSEIVGLQDRLLSRLKWGLSADLQTPDTDTRIAILKQKLSNDGVEIPEDVVEYLAYNIKTNVRELEGALVSLIAQSTLNHKTITLDLAKEITNRFVSNIVQEVSIETIQREVSDYFGISVENMLEASRKREIVQARQMTMYLAKKYTKQSLAAIGSCCGKKDHATVLHAIKTIEQLDKSDKHYHTMILEIERRIGK